MRRLLALLSMLSACAPSPVTLPCNNARECPGTTCERGRCNELPFELSVYPADEPRPLGISAPEFPPPERPRATAGLIALFTDAGERSGWGDDLEGALPAVGVVDVPLGARVEACAEGFTLEAFAMRPPEGPPAPLLTFGEHTLRSIGAAHHALVVDLVRGEARRYADGALVEVVEEDAPAASALSLHADVELAAVYCRALSEDDLARNRAVGPRIPPRAPGALLRYRLASGAGDAVDEGAGVPLNLTVLGDATWVPGGLRVDAARLEGGFATKLHDAVDEAITVEAWLTAEGADGCIVADLAGIDDVNFELSQQGDQLNVTVGDDVESAPMSALLVHVVFTHDGDALSVYRNAELVGQRSVDALELRPGHFGLGDALSGGRPWRGVLHDVTVYDRALTWDEVRQNHAHGPEATP